MPKICYKSKKFTPAHQEVIAHANVVLDEYAAQGFDLTLRQLFYQFVSRSWLPNTQVKYKWLGGIINDARLAGQIDWSRLVDRTRFLRERPHWRNPAEIIDVCAAQFRIDKWQDQDYRPEVWIEKDALIGVVEPVSQELDVPCFSCRGYVSASEMWSAARRMQVHANNNQQPVIFHLGDHDPSGIQMTEDIRKRLNDVFNVEVEVRRIALTMEQVEEFNPPPNPAKETDARFQQYQAEYGDECWELDALDPTTLANLIRQHVEGVRNDDRWEEAEEQESRHREDLLVVSRHWDEVVRHAREED